jgi:hypothetical protein
VGDVRLYGRVAVERCEFMQTVQLDGQRRVMQREIGIAAGFTNVRKRIASSGDCRLVKGGLESGALRAGPASRHVPCGNRFRWLPNARLLGSQNSTQMAPVLLMRGKLHGAAPTRRGLTTPGIGVPTERCPGAREPLVRREFAATLTKSR